MPSGNILIFRRFCLFKFIDFLSMNTSLFESFFIQKLSPKTTGISMLFNVEKFTIIHALQFLHVTTLKKYNLTIRISPFIARCLIQIESINLKLLLVFSFQYNLIKPKYEIPIYLHEYTYDYCVLQ